MPGDTSHSPRRDASPGRAPSSPLRRQYTSADLNGHGASAPSGRRQARSKALNRLRMHDGQQARFGAVKFTGTKHRPAKWAAVSTKSHIEDIYELLTDTWGLKPPPVLISVTGAGNNTIDLMPAKERTIFRRGLREAARRVGAWIITGGTNAGVMSLVGSMVHSAEEGQGEIVCLGMMPAGIVQRHEEMLTTGQGAVFNYHEPRRGGSSKVEGSRAQLEPNHSHFILIDNGTTGKYGVEISNRIALEDYICSPNSPSAIRGEPGEDPLPTPMVLLVVSGGPGTLRTVLETLEKDRPVVVMSESGGVATDIYNYMKYGTFPPLSDKFEPGTSVPENKNYVDQLREKLPIIERLGSKPKGANHTRQLTFFSSTNDVDGQGNDLCNDILEAILSDCEKTVQAVMHAVKWSEPSVIENQLFKSKAVDPVGLTRAFQTALVLGTTSEDAEKVVRTLIAYNADPAFVHYDKLWIEDNDPFGVIRRHITNQHAVKAAKRKKTSMAVKVLNMSSATKQVGDSPSGQATVDGFEILREEGGEFLGYNTHLSCRTDNPSRRDRQKAGPVNFAMRSDGLTPNWMDLMMWAALTGEPALAKILWSKTFNPLRAAIMASRLAKKLVLLHGEESDEGAQAQREGEMYEHWALKVLDQLPDYQVAAELLTLVPLKPPQSTGSGESLPVWKDSVMDQACDDTCPCKAFVAHKHCQALLEHYYHGDHCSSSAMIAPGTPFTLLVIEMMLQMVHLFTLGALRGLLPDVVPVLTPKFRVEADQEDEDENDDYDDDCAPTNRVTTPPPPS